MFYKLIGHDAVKVDSIEWSDWFETADRCVNTTTIGDCTIYTSFLGVNHNFDRGPPLLFETMIRTNNGDWLDYQKRYSTWDEAEKGHVEACEWVKQRCC